MVKKMDDPNMSGRQTPGIGSGSKPATPGLNQNGPNPMGPNAASHGAPMRYGPYGGAPMHPAYGSQMMPQGGAHPGMAPHHVHYGQGAYGHAGIHPMQQSLPPPPQQQQHGGQFHGMHMMPPPSQYPNKAPPPPSPSAAGPALTGQQPPTHQQTPSSAAAAASTAVPPPSAPPSPHQQTPPPPPPHMMPGDRSAMAFYGQQRFGGPGQHGGAPPPQPPPSSSGHPPPHSAYYMRPPMGGGGLHGAKNSSYYGPNGPPPHGGYSGSQQDMRMTLQQQQQLHQQQQQHHQQMMMSGQHPSHHQHQMMMHHHQMQHQAGYGPTGHMGGENGREPPSASIPSSGTHAPTPSSTASTNHTAEGHRHPQPPPIMDEVSQTSTASSQAADDSCASADMSLSGSGHKQAGKHHLSHPSTPNTSNLGSPGAASMSSYHDDFDSVSSPSWPRTPASPALNSSHFSSESHHHSSSKRNDGIQKLYEMSDEPERRAFLDKYLQFQEERGQPLTQVPTISKIPLDLYRLYLSVRERGGFVEVTKGKLWKECGQICNIANSSSAAYTLRKQYMKHMLHFECKFDRGGIDPAPVIQQLDATTNSKKKSAALKATASAAAAAAATTAAASASASSSSQPRSSPSSVDHQPSSGGHGQAGAPHYGGHPHQQQHQAGAYDMEGHGGFAPPNTSVSVGMGTPYGHPHPSVAAQYGHPGHGQHPPHHPSAGDYPHYLVPGHSAPGHMPPPAPPPTSHPNSAPSAAAAASTAGGQPPTSASTPHNESISVKDPFADDEAAASTNSSPNYPPSRQPHYAMHPGGQGPYYNPMAPLPPHAQQQPHGGYPEGGHPAHGQSGHYPVVEGGSVPPYGRPPSTAPPPESSGPPVHPAHPQHAHPHYGAAGNGGSAPGAYQPRMSANGHSSHGYYGGAPPSIAYEQSPHNHQRPPFPAESAHHSVRPPMAPSPHDPHYGGHPSQAPPAPHPHSGSMHRYPASASMHIGSGPRGPYSSPQPPHPSQIQQPGPQYGSSADGFSKPGSEPYSQSGPRMQSPLAQRLLAAKEPPNSSSQSYPMNQPYSSVPRSSSPMQPSSSGKGQPASGSHHPNGPPPPSPSYQPMQQQANSNISWMPTSRYGAPKRHPDFAKPSAEHQHPSSFGQSTTPSAASSVAGTAGPGQYQAYPGGYQKQSGAPGAPWNRANEQSSVQYRMGSPAGPYSHPHSSGAYGGSSRAAEQQWHEGRSSSSGDGPHPSQLSTDGGGRPGLNWAHPRYGSAAAAAEYRNAAMHEQYNSSHQKMMAGHHFSPRGPNEAMAAGGGGGSGGGASAYLMHHHPSPGKMALSNQLAERRGVFQHSPGPPLFAAAAVGHPPSHHSQALLKHDIIFPPDSVEATVPTPTKQRKITSREFTALGPIDAWRLFMSLKSGLLAESTYALDVLNVYSNDDNSLSYLGLNNMPGLLEVLLEHYKCYLNEMFDNLFEDTEIGFEARQLCYELNSATRKYSAKKENAKKVQSGVKRKLKWYELSKDYEESESEKTDSDEEDEEDEMGLFLDKHCESSQSQQVLLTNTTNYTHVTRNGLPVKFQRTKSLFISDYDKSWDQIKNGFAIGHEHWAKGGGETTSHIVSHFEPKESRLRFVHIIKRNKSDTVLAKKNGNCTDLVEEEVMEMETGDISSERETVCSTAADIGDSGVYPKIRDCDQARYLKSRQESQLEEESYELEESPIVSGGDYHESIKARVLTVSNLIRNLTFVPGNDVEMCKHPGLMLILSRLILLHHQHAEKKRPTLAMSLAAIKAMDENSLPNLPLLKSDSAESETMLETKWFSDALHLLRENTLVTLANLSCHLKLAPFPEAISRPLLDGILHWATCPSSYAQDSLPSAHYSLSPKRLAFETLTKLSISEANVDLILATPPWHRFETLLLTLVRSLGRQEEQTMREFSVVLLSNFSTEAMALRAMVALRPGNGSVHSGGLNTVGLLIGFIEQAEQSALHVVNSGNSYQALRETPDLALGTTVDMIRRAAATLRAISRSIENQPLFVQFETRLLSLAMSPVLDQVVAATIADILYESSFVSARRQLLLEEARALAAAQAARDSSAPSDAAQAMAVIQAAVVLDSNDRSPPLPTNDSIASSATEHHSDSKKTGGESVSADTTKQVNGQKEVVEVAENAKSTSENAISEVISNKTAKNRPTSSSGETSSKVSTSECSEKVNNLRSKTKMINSANVKQSETVVKAVEASNGFEHKSPSNASSKNHFSQIKSEHSNSNNNTPSVSRMTNGGLASLVHNNNNNNKDKSEESKRLASTKQPQTIFDTNPSHSNSLPSMEFFSNQRNSLPQVASLMGSNDAVRGTNNSTYYPSPSYASSRDHLLSSSKSISASNGVLQVNDEVAAAVVGVTAATVVAKKSVTVSVASAASVATTSDLNNAVGGAGTAPATIIEASST